MAKYEYYLRYWDEVENDDIIKRQTGISDMDYWFDTDVQRQAKKKELNAIARNFKACIVFAEYEGEDVRLKTFVDAVFEYDGRQYPISYDFNYCFPVDSARFMFEDGNYCCDCNRSLFINEKFPDFLEMKCGDKIKMVSMNVVKR